MSISNLASAAPLNDLVLLVLYNLISDPSAHVFGHASTLPAPAVYGTQASVGTPVYYKKAHVSDK